MPAIPALPQLPGGEPLPAQMLPPPPQVQIPALAPGAQMPPMDASLLSQGSTMGQTQLPPLPNIPGVSVPPVNPDQLPPIPELPPMPQGVSAQNGIQGYSPPMSQTQIQQLLAAAP